MTSWICTGDVVVFVGSIHSNGSFPGLVSDGWMLRTHNWTIIFCDASVCLTSRVWVSILLLIRQSTLNAWSGLIYCGNLLLICIVNLPNILISYLFLVVLECWSEKNWKKEEAERTPSLRASTISKNSKRMLSPRTTNVNVILLPLLTPVTWSLMSF